MVVRDPTCPRRNKFPSQEFGTALLSPCDNFGTRSDLPTARMTCTVQVADVLKYVNKRPRYERENKLYGPQENGQIAPDRIADVMDSCTRVSESGHYNKSNGLEARNHSQKSPGLGASELVGVNVLL